MNEQPFIAIDFGSKAIKACKKEKGQLVYFQHCGRDQIIHQASLEKFGLVYFNNSIETTKDPMISDYLQFFTEKDFSNKKISEIKTLNLIDDVYIENGKAYYRYVKNGFVKKAHNLSLLTAFLHFLLRSVIKQPKASYVLSLPNDFQDEQRNIFYTIFKEMNLNILNIYSNSEAIEEYFMASEVKATETNVIIDLGVSDLTVSIIFKSQDGFKRRERRHFKGLGLKVFQKILYKKLNPDKSLGHQNEVDNFFFLNFLKEIQMIEHRADDSELFIIENDLNRKSLKGNYLQVKEALNDYFLNIEIALKELKAIIKGKTGAPTVLLISCLNIEYFVDTLLKHIGCTRERFRQEDSRATVRGLQLYHEKMRLIGNFRPKEPLKFSHDLQMLSRLEFFVDQIKQLKALTAPNPLQKANASIFESFTILQNSIGDNTKMISMNEEGEAEELERQLKEQLSLADSEAKLNSYPLMLPYFRMMRLVAKKSGQPELGDELLGKNPMLETRVFFEWLLQREAQYFSKHG